MFREKYKEELNHLVLDATFKENLAQKMREKQIELQQQPEQVIKSKNKKFLITILIHNTHGKRFSYLPMMASLCIVCILSFGVINMINGSGNKNSSSKESNFNESASQMQESDTTSGSEAKVEGGYDQDTTDGSTDYKFGVSDSSKMDMNPSDSEESSESQSSLSNGNLEDESLDASIESSDISIESSDTSEENLDPSVGSIEYDEIIDYEIIDEYIPTPADELDSAILHMMNQSRGSNQVVLDYATWDRIILHDDWGFMVYDLTNQEILRAIDFKEKLGFDQDVDYKIQVLSGGNFLTIQTSNSNDTDKSKVNDITYLYKIQTNEWVEMTQEEYEATNPPAYVNNIISQKYMDGGILNNQDSSDEIVYLDKETLCTLFYQDPKMKSIASLSVYLYDLHTQTETICSIFD